MLSHVHQFKELKSTALAKDRNRGNIHLVDVPFEPLADVGLKVYVGKAQLRILAVLLSAAVLTWWPPAIYASGGNRIEKVCEYAHNSSTFTFFVKNTSSPFILQATNGTPCSVYVYVSNQSPDTEASLVVINLRRPSTCAQLHDLKASVYTGLDVRQALLCETNTNDTFLYVWVNTHFILFLDTDIAHETKNITKISLQAPNVTEVINICIGETAARELTVDNTAYAFASNSRFIFISPNHINCTRMDYNLTIFSKHSSDVLNLTVLTAPPAESNWMLLINGSWYNKDDSLNMEPSSKIELRYKLKNNCASMENCKSEGFILRVDAIKLAGEKDIQRSSVATQPGAGNVQLTTVSGMPNSSSSEPDHRQESGWSSHGNAAIIAGTIASAAVAIGVIAFCQMRARRQRSADKSPPNGMPLPFEQQSTEQSTSRVEESIAMVDNNLYGTDHAC